MTEDKICPAYAVSDLADLNIFLNFDPLLSGGPAALAPDLEASVQSMALSGVYLRWPNAFNEITIRKADDLYACAAAHGHYYDPIPKGADLIRAAFNVQFIDAARPRAMEIIPPHTLALEDPADAPRILQLLARRGFSTIHKLVLALLLAVTCALPDTLWADTTDDSDDDDDRLEFKSEIRSTKSETNVNDRKFEWIEPGDRDSVLVIVSFEFSICFGFRTSCFGFPSTAASISG
jgi:hypothetical protein